MPACCRYKPPSKRMRRQRRPSSRGDRRYQRMSSQFAIQTLLAMLLHFITNPKIDLLRVEWTGQGAIPKTFAVLILFDESGARIGFKDSCRQEGYTMRGRSNRMKTQRNQKPLESRGSSSLQTLVLSGTPVAVRTDLASMRDYPPHQEWMRTCHVQTENP